MKIRDRKGSGRRRAGSCLARLAFPLAVAISCLVPSCAKSAPLPWMGEYAGISKGNEANRASLAIGEARKGEFLFSLALARENGYTREISGKALFKGRTAAHSGDGFELAFALGGGTDPAIELEAKGPSIEEEGLAMKILLERLVPGGEAAPGPRASSSPQSTSAPAVGNFRFGYYLPEGAEIESLPESLDFLFFEREGMKLREIRMFEGMTDEGKDLGVFALEADSIRITGKDPKTGKKSQIEWKREAGGAIVSDSGQRYFFWKGNLGE